MPVFIGDYPAAAISELTSTGSGIDLLAIDGPAADKLRKDFPFFSADNLQLEFTGTLARSRPCQSARIG